MVCVGAVGPCPDVLGPWGCPVGSLPLSMGCVGAVGPYPGALGPWGSMGVPCVVSAPLHVVSVSLSPPGVSLPVSTGWRCCVSVSPPGVAVSLPVRWVAPLCLCVSTGCRCACPVRRGSLLCLCVPAGCRCCVSVSPPGVAAVSLSPPVVAAVPQVLQRGRFSSVWAGSLRRRPVAIKAFAARGAARFRAERAVHALPLMEHRNVARLLGARAAGPRAAGGILVLQLYPAGSLRQFLAHHVGTWVGTVRLALSLARGLAFLHQELWRDGLYKPSVVHRDLSSQNVLVRDDGTCAIGDFGLALALPPCAQGGATAPRAGTQRYLAPEILDESLDLHAWGRALLQADVYALGLLLWEILTRCQALSPGESPVPPFRLAYEAELGSSPTGAQLRRLAVDERRRPLIPPAWHRPGALPELLEDCWDPDPEARLSAERVLQRLQRLAQGD
uniref:receptor protein serine/threonine kinase n=1 Tax=Melopsittacus undulatus TaxID=13146 RepID=A0A8V5GSR3_MELUD